MLKGVILNFVAPTVLILPLQLVFPGLTYLEPKPEFFWGWKSFDGSARPSKRRFGSVEFDDVDFTHDVVHRNVDANLRREYFVRKSVKATECLDWNFVFVTSQTNYSKNTFGFSILYCTAFNVDDKSYTDPSQQFSAPFKAGNTRQVLNCYKPTIQMQRKLQHFIVYTGTGETGVLMTLTHWALT
jgi:hypothetical protein